MLTQKQIDIIRSRDCTFSGELDELLDMAEMLLAIFDLAKPLAERKASVYLSTSDALKENHAAICKIAAYWERGNK